MLPQTCAADLSSILAKSRGYGFSEVFGITNSSSHWSPSELRALENLPEIPVLKFFYPLLWAFDYWVLDSSMAYEEKKRCTDFALMSSVQVSPFQLKPLGDWCSYPKLLVKLTLYTSFSVCLSLLPQSPLKETMTLWFMYQATFSCNGKSKLWILLISC